MKKLLALVLALVMTLSLAVVGSNAAFKDAKDVNETYSEAVDVLSGMGVFNGYKNADGTYSFQPKGDITRAEVAAIVYRLYTADVTDKQASLYATYNKFSDMNGAAWAAGYIGYCANAGLIKGYDAKTFGPSDKVTGYQALAMILRAMGYDKNGEFTGANWQLYVAQTAQQLGILKNAGGESLQAPASRQLVAELLFQAIQKPCVTYTPAFGYVANSVVGKQDSLGVKNFGLTKTDADSSADKWGRPYYVWFDARDTTNGKYSATLSTVYATVKATPDVKYTTKVTECDIASDLSLKANTVVDVYDNGDNSVVDWTIRPLATTATKGAQGQQVEIYLLANGSYRAVVIDTYLAKVISNTNLTYDNAGHVRTNASIALAVYKTAVAAEATASNLTLTSSTANFEYAKGDYVLVNVNKTASKSDILGKAESIDGAQTVIYTNADKHTVEGTDYADAAQFKLDMAQKDGKLKYTWFFDQFGNLIGDKQIATVYTYGTITSMWWAEDNTTGGGKAMATVVYMDGTGETVELDTVDGNSLTYSITGLNAGSPMYVDSVNKVLYLAPYASTNYAADSVTGNADALAGTAGTVKDGHLFRFLKDAATGKVTAEKVANPTSLAMVDQTANTVSPKVSVIAGNIRTNDSTVYLIQKVGATATAAKTYESYTGFANIPALQNAKADAIDLDSDGYADYVYLTGDAANVKTSGLFFISNVSYSYDVATKTYSVNGYVDGESGKAIQVSDATGSDNWDSGNNILSKLVADTLYVVKYENGIAVDLVAVDTTATAIAAKAAGYTTYTVAEYKDYDVVKVQNGNVSNNNYRADNNFDYFIGGVTPVVGGAWTDNMSDKTVYLVYGTNRTVVSAYIVAQDNYSVSVAADLNAVTDSNIVQLDGGITVTKVASGTRAWFNIDTKAGYEVTGYTINGRPGTATIGSSGNHYYVAETVTGDTTVVFTVAPVSNSSAISGLTVTAGGSTLTTPTKAYTTVEAAVANALSAKLTGNASVTVTATVTSGNVNVGVFGGVPTVLAAGSNTTATATGNLATGSYILVNANGSYVAYLVG